MDIKKALNEGSSYLKLAGIDTSVLETGVILCHVINCDKIFIYTNEEYELTASEQMKFKEMLEKRVKRIPLQYIIGKQEFMSLDFYVTSDVLIPRQDTEVLVETIIDKLKLINQKDILIGDIGTGSGCIAISLAYYLKHSKIVSMDISTKALAVAKTNAINIGVDNRITFLESDILSGIKSGVLFDVIVSNPPYIPTNEIEELSKEVKNNEPFNALDGGEDGLYFYKNIVNNCRDYLKKDGYLFFEIGYNQASEVLSLMSETFYNLQVIKDYGDNDRVVLGQLG